MFDYCQIYQTNGYVSSMKRSIQTMKGAAAAAPLFTSSQNEGFCTDVLLGVKLTGKLAQHLLCLSVLIYGNK